MHFRPLLLISALFCLFFPACESTGVKTAHGLAPDHKPRYDYWQHGGGA